MISDTALVYGWYLALGLLSVLNMMHMIGRPTYHDNTIRYSLLPPLTGYGLRWGDDRVGMRCTKTGQVTS